jgi:hypothetical protein
MYKNQKSGKPKTSRVVSNGSPNIASPSWYQSNVWPIGSLGGVEIGTVYSICAGVSAEYHTDCARAGADTFAFGESRFQEA